MKEKLVDKRSPLWNLWRQDDNGNKFLMKSFYSEQQAAKAKAEFEEKKHKQIYWIEKIG